MAKSKYICIRQDQRGGFYNDKARIYKQDGIRQARMRACKMIHGGSDTVYIFEDGYPEGYVEWVSFDRKSKQYFLVNKMKVVSPYDGRLLEQIW